MTKEFNITGTCIPEMHYMVNAGFKMEKIFDLIEKGKYFTINRPRQYGKTTTMLNIEKTLLNNPDYIVSSISFEGIGDTFFQDETIFAPFVFKKIADGFALGNEEIQSYIYKTIKKIKNFDALSQEITLLIKKYNKKVVILIDEVDKSSNNQLFLSFLGMLRNKYLQRNAGKDSTFHSVILAGVHDVKNLKLKLRPDEEQKFNSPWNIATEFKVDMSFNPAEIATILQDYVNETKTKMNIPEISQRIYHYSSGYPFLVSRICKEVDEEILVKRNEKNWTISDIDNAVKAISIEKNTCFGSLIKNIENNTDLTEFIKRIILGSTEFNFVAYSPLIEIGYIYGIFDKNSDNKVKIHNKLFEEVITEYMVSKIKENSQDNGISNDVVRSTFIKPNGKLNFEKILLKFQEVIKEKYSKSDLLKSSEFLENNLRMLFLVFLKPIINGVGFSFKEVETSEEKRLDIVVIYLDEKFIVELKIWRGDVYHKQGILQLKDYMKREGAKKGYMLIMDKNRSKEFITYEEEDITMVWI